MTEKTWDEVAGSLRVPDGRGGTAVTEDACPFCQLAPGRVIDSNELAMAIRDRFPVNEGHTLGGVRLVIPERGNHRQRGRIPKVPEGGGARGP